MHTKQTCPIPCAHFSSPLPAQVQSVIASLSSVLDIGAKTVLVATGGVGWIND